MRVTLHDGHLYQIDWQYEQPIGHEKHYKNDVMHYQAKFAPNRKTTCTIKAVDDAETIIEAVTQLADGENFCKNEQRKNALKEALRQLSQQNDYLTGKGQNIKREIRKMVWNKYNSTIGPLRVKIICSYDPMIEEKINITQTQLFDA